MFPIEIKSLQIFFCYKLAWQILEDILMIQNYKYQQRSSLLKIKTSKWTNNTDKIKLWERQTETHTLTLVSCQLCVLPALADVIHDAQKPRGCTNFLLPHVQGSGTRDTVKNHSKGGFSILHLLPQLRVQDIWAELVLGRQTVAWQALRQ